MYDTKSFISELEKRNPAQPEFIQAAGEVVSNVIDVVNDNPIYIKNKILERITEPDRVISFKVEWEDDNHEVQVNKGYRVQFNNALGPYKGGLRFHSSDSKIPSQVFLWEAERGEATFHPEAEARVRSCVSAGPS